MIFKKNKKNTKTVWHLSTAMILLRSRKSDNKKWNEIKKFEKKFKKCLTERDRHDKLIKSPKQGDMKFFEN